MPHYLDNDGLTRVWGKIKALVSPSNLVDIFYPVGSYYETTDTTFDPNTAWGGTWALEDEGLVHVSSGTNYAVSNNSQDGGEATHILTSDESGIQATSTYGGGSAKSIIGGSHTHQPTNGNNNFVTDGNGTAAGISIGGAGYVKCKLNTSTHTHDLPNHTHNIAGASAKVAHNNMQPYKIVNRWHRTA